LHQSRAYEVEYWLRTNIWPYNGEPDPTLTLLAGFSRSLILVSLSISFGALKNLKISLKIEQERERTDEQHHQSKHHKSKESFELPKWTIEEDLRQPNTIRIKFDTNETGVNSRGRIREISADIVPHKGLYGPEYAMIFTIPQFRDKVITRLDPADPNFVSQLFTLFG